SIGWGLSSAYPNQEGSFFGNIFRLGAHGVDPTQIAAFYCNGRAYDKNVVPGRIGAGQNDAPYVDPFAAGGYCADYCTPSDYPNEASGYKACYGWNNVITTYRQAAPPPSGSGNAPKPPGFSVRFRRRQ